jgi:hypothetical protein
MFVGLEHEQSALDFLQQCHTSTDPYLTSLLRGPCCPCLASQSEALELDSFDSNKKHMQAHTSLSSSSFGADKTGNCLDGRHRDCSFFFSEHSASFFRCFRVSSKRVSMQKHKIIHS